MTLEAQVSATTVHTGQPITVTVHVADDAQIACPMPHDETVDGDGVDVGCVSALNLCGTSQDSPGYPSGPWDSPSPSPSEINSATTVTFTTPGNKTLYANFFSAGDIPVAHGCPIPNPYASSAGQQFTIIVN
jgi:hypothetical protein